MQDAPQQNDQTAPDSEPLDEQALDHVAGGMNGGLLLMMPAIVSITTISIPPPINLDLINH